MTATLIEREAKAGAGGEAALGVVDCDIHPAVSHPGELIGFLPKRWQTHVAEYGARVPNPLFGAFAYPRMTPGNGMRGDAWPPNGGPPASDLGFLREQLLDAHDIAFGMLQPLAAGALTFNQELGAAMCRAANEWQLEKYTRHERRLKAAICVPQEDAEAAVAEIEHWADHPDFVQVAISPRILEPHGRRRYWPIYEAAERHGLPIGLHPGAYGPRANTGSGWSSFYIEEHFAFAFGPQSVLTSLIFEGVFERFPDLKIVLIEGGFAWAPPLLWRLDKCWERMRAEVPDVRRPPSEYARRNVWFTTQPIEEPETNHHLTDTIRWLGADRLMFSTDYPHWDFDDPRYAFKVPLSGPERAMIFRENAVNLYGLA